ncbi:MULTISPECIES: DMT family transporter [Paenibacillus]|uniref:QacE family quaternary ammonium compound efflux SMR transporter n=3 Tax=Paenibacillus macerans TaxID=44252 RepID=A0A090ZNL0_PAEMA|nr:SMR family transporter [Paenibacillus macerans]KFN12182.1 small Multidrug Resistance family protein [Paenibacillus macerans]MCY7558743.1 SMR family transporter [Paenibacillus macerans]MEC0153081.1 SMR family transporter [Paenibacillus macerans]MUG23546.1 QacE family quaternary ammonium compound efflux SMR transporter [Paenibacillus macerans]UMV45138.1 QacE family quaternary ammonium compound efflux SMR transporter [Paenibacillus macerans]
MGWLFVFVAALLELVGVIGLKKFSQKKSMLNLLMFFGGFGGSFAFLYASFNYLQVSIAYAVWIGIGTSAAVLVNMIFFGESKSIGRIISLMIIVIGVVGLKAVS